MAVVILLICVAFVLCLLAIEKQASASLSLASWIPTAWMLIAASRPIATWFYGSGGSVGLSNESGSPIDFWILTSLGALGFLVLIRRRVNWSTTLRQHRWLFILLVYMLVSAFWSELPLISLKRWVRQGIVVEMALLLIAEANPIQALSSVFRRCAYVCFPLSVVLIKYYPTLGREYGRWSGIQMWSGVARQKNELGRLCMICIFFLLIVAYERWRKQKKPVERRQAWADYFTIAIGLYLLIGSDSETSLVTLMIGVAIFLGLQWFKKRRLPLLIVQACTILFVAYGASLPLLGGSPAAAFTSSLGRDTTLTGRTEVWAEVIPAWKKQPLFGYGIESFWTDTRRDLYEIPNAHNGYLDIMLGFGGVGLGIYIVWFLSCGKQLHRGLRQHYVWASFAICILFMILIYNSTESALDSLGAYPTAVLVLVCVAVPAHLRSRSSAKKVVLCEMKAGALPLESRVNIGFAVKG